MLLNHFFSLPHFAKEGRDRGTGKELKLIGNHFSRCLGGQSQELAK